MLIANVEIAHVVVVLSPTETIAVPELLPFMFSVVPVMVTEVAPVPKDCEFEDAIVNAAFVQTRDPPTEMFIPANDAVLELQKFSVVDALACVNVYVIGPTPPPGLLNVVV